MRVAYVLKRYPRYSETFIVNEILAHEAAGLGVEIFALRNPNDRHFQDSIARVRAPVHYLTAEALRASRFWSALQRIRGRGWGLDSVVDAARGESAREVYQAALLARAVEEKGIDHLHAHFATSATSVARLAARFAGVAYTFTTHAKDIFHREVDRHAYRRKLEDAAAVVTVSDYNVRFLAETYGGAAGHVERIYNGLHLERFTYESPRVRPPTIVAVGRLVEKKGFDDLVDACALLAARGREFRCQIVGSGELSSSLLARIESRGLGNRVSLTGPRPQDEIIELVRRAAVFAAPCVVGGDGNRDGLPTVLLEAMALGTPCVSTPVTGIPEVVRDGETGLLVGERDLPALAASLERLLDDPVLRVRLADSARRLIAREFDVRRNAERLRRLFSSAALAAAGPASAAV